MKREILATTGVLLSAAAIANGNPGELGPNCVADRNGNGIPEVQQTVGVAQMDSRLPNGNVQFKVENLAGGVAVTSYSGDVQKIFRKPTDVEKQAREVAGIDEVVVENDNYFTGQRGYTAKAHIYSDAPAGEFTAYAKLSGVDNGRNGILEVTKKLTCYTPETPKTPDTPKTPETPVTPVVPVTPTVPVTPKPPRPFKENKAPKISIEKTFNGAPYYVKNGKVVKVQGESVRRVSPGQIFNMNIAVTSQDDGDAIKGEKTVVTWADALPQTRLGNIALMLAKDATTGKFTIGRIGGKMTIKEGQTKVINVPVTTTLEAARPPRILQNCAVVKVGKNIVDKDCAWVFDPIKKQVVPKAQ